MKKNTEISERLNFFLEKNDLNKNEFAKKLGYARSQSIYDIMNGKSKPSFDFFQRFFSSEYSEKVNHIWLFTGFGEYESNNKNVDLSDVSTKDMTYNIRERQSEFLSDPLFVKLVKSISNSVEIVKREDRIEDLSKRVAELEARFKNVD